MIPRTWLNPLRFIALAVISFAHVVATTTSCAAPVDDPIQSVELQQVVSSVESSHTSEPFNDRVSRAAASIPENVWAGLLSAGWRLSVAEFVVDAEPTLKHKRPRGWPRAMTWENTDAVHLPNTRHLIIAEKLRTVAGKVVFSRRVEGNLRHEVGHAFDMLTGRKHSFLSSSSAFLVEYRRDWYRLSKIRRANLAYYSQSKNVAGPQEAFAEAFAIHLGGGSDLDQRQKFVDSFPSVMKFVRMTVESYRSGGHNDSMRRRLRFRR